MRLLRIPQFSRLLFAALASLALGGACAWAVAPSTVYVNSSFAGTAPGADPDGAGPATAFGVDAFATIQQGVNGVAAGGTVQVSAGSYLEDVSIGSAGLKLIGAGAGSTTLIGAIGGNTATVQVGAINVEIAGFTITRDGNTVAQWTDPGLNSAGISLSGSAANGALIHDNLIRDNRVGIDVNNSGGHTIRNNQFDYNRQALIFRNQTDNLAVEENAITNSYAVAILFLDASGGTNSPVQGAANSNFRNNSIAASWYAAIVDRQTGGSLPPPGANLKNFPKTWFGTATPVTTTVNSTEPGYAAQIPVRYGGTAVPPGGQPDIAGPASANFVVDPVLDDGTDGDVETTPGRGTFGFQGNYLPKLDAIAPAPPTMEDDPGQTVNLSGIAAGFGETQTLSVTAVSSDPSVIPNPSVNYTTPSGVGSITYQPLPNKSGTTTITVSVSDGVATASQSFVVDVIPVNDAPTLDLISDPAAILEDADVQTVDLSGISAGGGESQLLTVTATSSNPSLIPNPTVHYANPDGMGSLEFQPVADASGTAVITVTVQDDGGTDNGGVDTTTRTFTITVKSVNDAPTLAFNMDPPAILEDAPMQTVNLSGIGAGGDESQVLTVTATSSNPALIPDPTVTYSSPNSTGVLQYQPVAGQSGTAVISVTVHDNGGTANGGVDSITRSFNVGVLSVDDAPTLAAIANPDPIREDAGAQTVMLMGISAGNGESQTLTVTATSSNPAVVPNPTVIYSSPDTTGSLSYQPVANANGTVTITVKVQDDGSTINGGVNTVTRTFDVTVLPVNDSPTFTSGGDVSTAQDAGHQALQWATAISAGPANESGQALSFTVTNDRPGLFTEPPSISSTGVLTFTPEPSASGTATMHVTLHDDGGTANNGVDASAEQTFTIAVTTFLEESGTYNGLAQAPASESAEHQRTGLIRVKSTPKGTFSGKLQLGGVAYPLKGRFDKGGVAHFKQDAPKLALTADRELTLQLDVGGGSDTLSGTITEQGVEFSVIEADRALYSGAKVPLAPLMPTPPALVSKYTAQFPPKSEIDQALPAFLYPQGYGVASVTVSKAGVVTLRGTLADGSPIAYANSLSKTNAMPFYVALAKGKGSISGTVQFTEEADGATLAGTDLNWFKPGGSKVYPTGWDTGIKVDLAGGNFAKPPAAQHESVFLLLSDPDSDGNVDATLSGGDIDPPGLLKSLNVQPTNRVQVVLVEADKLALTLNPATGLVAGSFIHPVSLRKTAIKGVIDQRNQLGFGFFLGPSESGSLLLQPTP